MFEWIESVSRSLAEFINSTLGPPADFLEHYVWGGPEIFGSEVPLLAAILLGTGLYVTLRLAFIQIRGFRHAVNVVRGKYDNPEDEGDLNHFQALTTALSATVGIGNIAGVAIAIRLGGPGALFWMWVTAFFGMALKYVECTLALMHRRVHPDGSISGGPMYYIEMGLGPKFKWLAMAFAGFAAISSFGAGCMNQSNSLADQVNAAFNIPTAVTGLVFAAVVAAVIIGGIRRIGRVTSVLAPAMAMLYVGGALLVLVQYVGQIPSGLALIVSQAFAPEPMVGGGVGSIMLTLMWGIRRGLFSNEAGQGSAPIAHAAAKTTEPVREGLVASLGPFIDTLVICTLTGLVIVLTGANIDKAPQQLALSELEGVAVAGAVDERYQELIAARAASSSVSVRDGVAGGASFFVHHSTLDDTRFEAGGAPWNGTLQIDAEGNVSVDGAGEAPAVLGAALLTGAPLTAFAFGKGLGGFGGLIVTLAVILFAVSTGISWSYYGDRSVEYLFGDRAVPIYRWMFIGFFFMGAILPLKAVWTFGDVALGLMTFPNLIGVFLLTGGVVKLTKNYMSREHTPYR